MAEQPFPETALLAQVLAADNTEAPSLCTTRRGSQPPARGTEDSKPLPLLSRRNSILSRRSSFGMVPGSRRPSIGPWMLHRRVSFSGLPIFQPILKTRLENTYRIGPDKGCKFDAEQVQRVLEGTLARALGTTVYNPQGSAPLAQSLTELLQNQAKEVVPPRYKLVCHVVLGQQSLLVASRGLWDPETDSFASATFSNTSLFAVATVYGVYFE
ncbi:PREDICTED: tctex1 domain-containing protein 4 [Pseudopodoces humilis]|uniref:tctex1 domain-containing protein 4 n=1 Tax=Pseudopodoces humilis TaxID=181119 RepID=UPI000395E12E|nr:PREDICTED: tctex1 domain-containing protein 4 [Pseudopodoces humilis]